LRKRNNNLNLRKLTGFKIKVIFFTNKTKTNLTKNLKVNLKEKTQKMDLKLKFQNLKLFISFSTFKFEFFD